MIREIVVGSTVLVSCLRLVMIQDAEIACHVAITDLPISPAWEYG